jgi:hypothetical protein
MLFLATAYKLLKCGQSRWRPEARGDIGCDGVWVESRRHTLEHCSWLLGTMKASHSQTYSLLLSNPIDNELFLSLDRPLCKDSKGVLQ